MKGIIALDIDGTITAEHHALPDRVVDFFVSLVREGWRLIFITGRTFSWAYAVLKFVPVAYEVAVQNGAILIQMPARTILAKRYLDRSIFPGMDAICEKESSDYVIYAGFEKEDRCFYRPRNFSKELLHYLEARVVALEEDWQAVDSFSDLGISEFPSVKCFGLKESAERLACTIESLLGLHVPLVRDPFNENYYVAQATHAGIHKGQALRDMVALTKNEGAIIAAGDDNNDRSMLAEADVKVVMETAPQDMIDRADVVAPPASHFGIVRGLREAIGICKKRGLMSG
jgi:HAD superfamily hydrolase (TIGR01484 family)